MIEHIIITHEGCKFFKRDNAIELLKHLPVDAIITELKVGNVKFTSLHFGSESKCFTIKEVVKLELIESKLKY